MVLRFNAIFILKRFQNGTEPVIVVAHWPWGDETTEEVRMSARKATTLFGLQGSAVASKLTFTMSVVKTIARVRSGTFCHRFANVVAHWSFSCTLLGNLTFLKRQKLGGKKTMKIAIRAMLFTTVLVLAASGVPVPTPTPDPPMQSQAPTTFGVPVPTPTPDPPARFCATTIAGVPVPTPTPDPPVQFQTV